MQCDVLIRWVGGIARTNVRSNSTGTWCIICLTPWELFGMCGLVLACRKCPGKRTATNEEMGDRELGGIVIYVLWSLFIDVNTLLVLVFTDDINTRRRSCIWVDSGTEGTSIANRNPWYDRMYWIQLTVSMMSWLSDRRVKPNQHKIEAFQSGVLLYKSFFCRGSSIVWMFKFIFCEASHTQNHDNMFIKIILEHISVWITII